MRKCALYVIALTIIVVFSYSPHPALASSGRIIRLTGGIRLVGGVRLGGSSPIARSSYDPATIAWANAVVADGGGVSSNEEGYVDTLIKGLKADGIWSNLDRLWLLASENTHEAKIDLVNLQSNTNNGATFNADQGYAGNGSTSYVDSGYAPSTSGVNLSQNSASFGIYDRTDDTGGDSDFGGEDTAGANALTVSLRSGNEIKWFVNDSTGQFDYPTTDAGMWVTTRTGASAGAVYHDGPQFDTTTNTSSGLTSSSIYISGGSDYGSGTAIINANTDQISAVSIGGGLTSTQAANLSSLINAYMTSIGSNVY
jgi:hypothetical protein